MTHPTTEQQRELSELAAVDASTIYPVPDDAGHEIDPDLCAWIPGDVKPVHEGPYVREFDEGEGLSWWNDGQWFTDSFFGPASDIQDAPWAGLTRESAAAIAKGEK